MSTGAQQLRLSDVISALTYALDITEGQPPGHAMRSCLIGMRIAETLELDDDARSSLFYALLLKDAGCSSNAAKICKLFRGDDLRLKQGVKTVDWSSFSENLIWAVRNVAPEGSPLARAATLVRLGLQQGTRAGDLRDALRAGRRHRPRARLLGADRRRDPDARRALGRPRPAARAERRRDPAVRPGRSASRRPSRSSRRRSGHAAAYEMARERRGAWFDPDLVRALESFEERRRVLAAPRRPRTSPRSCRSSSRPIGSSSSTTTRSTGSQAPSPA